MVGGRLFQKYWTGDLESAVTKECPELSSSSVYGGGWSAYSIYVTAQMLGKNLDTLIKQLLRHCPMR